MCSIKDGLRHLQYVDNKKTLFKLRVEVVSTVYTTDKHLNYFFFAARKKDRDPKLMKVVQSLGKVKPHTIIKFLPALFNQLLKVMCTVSNEEAAEVFIVLNQLLEGYGYLLSLLTV